MLEGCRELRQGTNSIEISQKTITKKRMAKLTSSIISCTENDFMRKLQNRLAHTFTYFANLGF
jgi:hypothetical protein